MENKPEFEVVENFCSEDEWNNFIIDLWVMEQKYKPYNTKGVTAISGETVTITLTPDNFV